MIPYGRQSISDADVKAVVDTLQSDFLTQGPAIPAFEEALAKYCKVPYAIAVNSATSALHIACLALDVKAGDRVWTSPISFVASANCALYCGAKVDFVDVEPDTGLMSVKALAAKLQQAAANNTLPKVLIPVHLAGHSCAMQQIATLCQPYGIRIIEDASHAIGGSYQQNKIGSCQFSDITVFSFHPVKIITTAEGGAALTKDMALAARMQLLRSHGITRNPDDMTEVSHGPWYYQQIDLGLNYRMTDLQAALGLSQLKRLDIFVNQRIEAVANYSALLQNLALELPQECSTGQSSWHLYIVKLHDENLRLSTFETLRAAGIGVNVHYIPIHTQPYYQKLGFQWGDFPQAEYFYSRIISLPLYADLTQKSQDYVASVLKKIPGLQ
ncbi:UDP-4-amino-4,6-dideoxy-N-acetyl-beta-L-altrosamine transaminase [Rheinheimera tangshanensis]|uniref:UDP-4-amino-4, 6-dideoxy-N-acetyl-beta-L-altrosamine transaminase n=1 Tax=Rheinheimera tangshanensis TaxID=400153 RepID=A0A5C8LWI8_9GAMM|nr:UDP-4-amino-4,6-dideoxy-N-acetyl-beta-L-altrosamine transaminase [Rheinheimera tangshanensis]TXK80443.1 UDP-4-amino-4,6-dideoxy-N-acetyl-beta-L-altrosamine transaminase [Rheinheimera tangshanensis]GGM61278.1 UDP-4-amino-4,6-dideoxy-N-acetyl-beta-L-altrosamine transaminase [Rheinheimera tangshanensis]